MKPYAFGIDVGGTSIKFGLFKEDCLKEKWSMPTDPSCGGKNISRDIAASLKGRMALSGIGPEDVEGAGMGVPGVISSRGYLEPCVNLGGWGGAGIEEELKGLCGFPFVMINDANAAGLGELKRGGGKGFESIYFITLGTGVGGCLIIEDKVISGAHGCCGEIGHIHIDDSEKRLCGCGKTGCLEQYVSARALEENAAEALRKTEEPSALRSLENITCRDIFDLAKEGDGLCLKIVDDMAELFGSVLAGIACVCNPEAFVIGGGMSAAGDFLIERLRASFKKYAFSSSEKTKILEARLGNEAGIWGGYYLLKAF